MYNNSSKWRIILAALGLVAVVSSIFYTNTLISDVVDEERLKLAHFVQAYESMGRISATAPMDCDPDLSLQTDIIKSVDVPIILVEEDGTITSGNNFGESKNDDIPYLTKQLSLIKKLGKKPLRMRTIAGTQYLYYKTTAKQRYIRYYPWVMLGLLSTFILMGYWNVTAARKSEQNQVWAGLAKETAHQLGTPISGIIAWMEHIKMIGEGNEEVLEIASEMEKDTDRLQLVADRFSKIGSAPKLMEMDVVEAVAKSFSYMERRAPKRVKFVFPSEEEEPYRTKINPHLFEWVIENLLKNALDSMGNRGQISFDLAQDNDHIFIDISDTGKGIPENKFNKVFQPGFSTKKRGWGLGLSLAKRIIELYHNGKIFVKFSKLGEGTTFRIQLPKN